MFRNPTLLCPRCEEDELWLCRYSNSVYIGCYECGWNFTITPRPADDELDDAIAQVVKEATVDNSSKSGHNV